MLVQRCVVFVRQKYPLFGCTSSAFHGAAERGALAISKGGEICSFAAHKLLFSFKGKSATAPLSLALSQGGVNFTSVVDKSSTCFHPSVSQGGSFPYCLVYYKYDTC